MFDQHPLGDVTIVMPHKDTPEWLRLSARMWLAQAAEPWLLIIDTGSTGIKSLAAMNEQEELGWCGWR